MLARRPARTLLIVCTLLLRFRPADPCPLMLAAVRDEYLERGWDPPAAHWGGRLLGGRDRVAGGTWLAVDPDANAVAAVLNGPSLPLPADGDRPSRGRLPLAALAGAPLPDPPELARYNGFHLVLATPDEVRVWSWTGAELTTQTLDPGDHIIVNTGADADDPVVTHFRPLLRKVESRNPGANESTVDAWGGWVTLLTGDGLDPTDPRALLVRRPVGEHFYGSTSAALVALGGPSAGPRYDFTAEPRDPSRWRLVFPR